MFTSSLFAVCNVGMTVNVQGELDTWGSGNGANVGAAGVDIYYTVIISRSGLCALEQGEVTLTIPDGAGGAAGVVFDLADNLEVAAEGSVQFTQDKGGQPLKYTIALADLGLVPGAGSPPEAQEVRAFADIDGFSVRDDGGDPQQGFAGQNFDTLVIDPAVCVTKSVECDISAPGYEVDYTIKIENCGDIPLDLKSIEDTLLSNPELTDLAIAAGCGFLDTVDGEEPNYCEFTYSLAVLEDDLEPDPNLVNEVLAIYDVNGVADATVQDDSDIVVDLIDPNFTVTKECVDEPLMVGADANFLITIVNIGTVDLVLESSEITDLDTDLSVGETQTYNVLQLVEECEDARNTVFVSATLPPELCFQLDEPLLRDASASCEVIDPDFTVVKNCLTDPVPADANAVFEIIVTNTSCGDVTLDFEIDDPAAGIVGLIVGPFEPEEFYRIEVQVPADCNDGVVSNTVYVEAFYGDLISAGEKEAEADCPCGGEDGCTPGFWKNHPDCWCESYDPEDPVADVFTALQDPNYIDLGGQGSKDKWDVDTDTLMDAINYGGGRGLEGAARNLLRHSVAAILNGCSGDVNYPISDALIIDLVNAALATEDVDMIQELHSVLAEWNEYGCPINAHCDPEDYEEE
ncbi:MAG: hypothetical protein ACYTCN_08530 [Planctomycetota bacterium]|jgi:hypothetical protein